MGLFGSSTMLCLTSLIKHVWSNLSLGKSLYKGYRNGVGTKMFWYTIYVDQNTLVWAWIRCFWTDCEGELSFSCSLIIHEPSAKEPTPVPFRRTHPDHNKINGHSHALWRHVQLQLAFGRSGQRCWKWNLLLSHHRCRATDRFLADLAPIWVSSTGCNPMFTITINGLMVRTFSTFL